MPRPRKALAPLRAASGVLKQALERDDFDELVDPEMVDADADSDAARNVRSDIRSIIDAVHQLLGEADGKPDQEQISKTVDFVSGAVLKGKEAVILRDALTAVGMWIASDDPSQEARSRLWGRSPDFLTFDEGQRLLESAYTLNSQLVEDPPGALANLAGAANLDLVALWSSIQTDDITRRDTAVTRANVQLEQVFRDAWKQSRLSVQFSMDGGVLRVGGH